MCLEIIFGGFRWSTYWEFFFLLLFTLIFCSLWNDWKEHLVYFTRFISFSCKMCTKYGPNSLREINNIMKCLILIEQKYSKWQISSQIFQSLLFFDACWIHWFNIFSLKSALKNPCYMLLYLVIHPGPCHLKGLRIYKCFTPFLMRLLCMAPAPSADPG